jgi:hypothetical protein
MNNKQQTSVQWLIEQFWNNEGMMTAKKLEIAEQMNRNEIAQAFDNGDYNYFYSKKTGKDFSDGQEYFNEVHGQEL